MRCGVSPALGSARVRSRHLATMFGVLGSTNLSHVVTLVSVATFGWGRCLVVRSAPASQIGDGRWLVRAGSARAPVPHRRGRLARWARGPCAAAAEWRAHPVPLHTDGWLGGIPICARSRPGRAVTSRWGWCGPPDLGSVKAGPYCHYHEQVRGSVAEPHAQDRWFR